MEILIIVVPVAVIAACWFFARVVKDRRKAGRQYEFRHPLPGAYGGGLAEIDYREGSAGTIAPEGEGST